MFILVFEAAGKGLKSKLHSATLSAGSKGVLHGMMTYLLQDSEGQITETHSISAGLDYPGVGPEHAYYKDTKRVKYHSSTDKEVLDAFLTLTRTEGIIKGKVTVKNACIGVAPMPRAASSKDLSRPSKLTFKTIITRGIHHE